MENTLRLYHTLIQVLSQHRKWLDIRHLKTLAWMMVGLIQSGMIGLNAWAPYVAGRARYAQSTVRRFARWLNNERIAVHQLYGPLLQQALTEWGTHKLYLALDTSLLWNRYCLVRLSLIYRGRAIPLVWQVAEQASSSVSYKVYQDLLRQADTLLPLGCQVVFLADRGLADTDLMADLKGLGWHWRIRIKSSFWVYRSGQRRCQLGTLCLAAGEARFWHNVYVTAKRYGPVHLALARPYGGTEYWLVLSDELTSRETLQEYGLRFDMEESFLDDKSNGFQLEASLIRSGEALSRLCFVLAITTLYLVSQGTDVVKQDKRRWVDPHWFRGSSYLKIGWNWIKAALAKGWELLVKLRLSGEPDPECAMSSKKQYARRGKLSFSTEFANYAC